MYSRWGLVDLLLNHGADAKGGRDFMIEERAGRGPYRSLQYACYMKNT